LGLSNSKVYQILRFIKFWGLSSYWDHFS